MKTLFILTACIFAIACRKEVIKGKESNDIGKLKDKIALYKELEKGIEDEHGWLSQDCDGLLWASLYAVTGANPNIDIAKDSDGAWHRNARHDCWPDKSKSTISQDMLLGLAFATYRQRNAARAKQVIDYGKAHGWVMGKGAVDRVIMRSQLRATWYAIAMPDTKLLPVYGILSGYQAHLLALHIWLRAEIAGGITAPDLATISRLAGKQPRNALFQALYHKYRDGDQGAAIAILSDEKLFPSDRLPASQDRCEGYLWQRDAVKDGHDNVDWLSCSDNKSHNGLDFLIAIEAMK